jgi:two-component system, sensor histidine kinase FlrB
MYLAFALPWIVDGHWRAALVATSDRLSEYELASLRTTPRHYGASSQRADRMLETLANERRERLSSIGEMTATLAHQIRTPLASALLYAKQLRSQADTLSSPAAHICDRLDEIARLIDDMLCYAGGARRADQRFSVSELFQNIVEISRNCFGEGQLRIALTRDDLYVAGNYEAIKGAMLNLVENAYQACGKNGRIELGAELVKDRVCLTVSDNGHGISVDIQDRLFEPFFTTRPKGTGLGLAVVRAVAEAHAGEVMVDSSARGTTFALCLHVDGASI